MKRNNGIFITFEGADGVGKSTHVAFYAELLKSLGYDVVLIREPGGTRIGEKVRELLLDVKNDDLTDESELLLYLAARSQIINEVINPALADGKVVLCDRFFDSTLAYQGFGRGLSAGFIESANKFVCGDCSPDLTILFYLPPDVRKQRLRRREVTDRIENAGVDFAERVADGFLQIANSNHDRIKLVDTSLVHSETAKKVIELTSHLVPVDINSSLVQEELIKLDSAHDHSKDNLN